MTKLKDRFTIEVNGNHHQVKRQTPEFYALFGKTWVKLKIENGKVKRYEDRKVLCDLPDSAFID
jgi:hypothetical protein